MSKTLREHYDFLSDRFRLQQYEAAIMETVQPGQVVLDLGCGSGVLGLMAMRAGASKVYFVDEGPVIEVARDAVSQAGYGTRARFFSANSFELELPERVDTVICDHIGCFGFDYGILALLADAKNRFLKPGGAIVPAELGIRLTPIESEYCRARVGKWHNDSIPDGFELLGSTAANTKYLADLEKSELLAEPATIAAFQLGDEASPFLSWNVDFTCGRDGMLDGVAGWFDCLLAGDIRLSNGPDVAMRSHRPQAFLPMGEPVRVAAGDRIRVTIMARHLDEVIGWVIELPYTNQRFAHSTFNGLFLDHESLTRVRPDRLACLNQRGRARQIVLSYCDGRRTVAEVQTLVQKEHPDLFPSERATSLFIARVLAGDTGE